MFGSSGQGQSGRYVEISSLQTKSQKMLFRPRTGSSNRRRGGWGGKAGGIPATRDTEGKYAAIEQLPLQRNLI